MFEPCLKRNNGPTIDGGGSFGIFPMPARKIAKPETIRRIFWTGTTTGERVIEYAWRKIRIAAPPHTGEPFTFAPWQEPLIKKIHDDSIKVVGISTPRKNGKSGMLQAGIILPASAIPSSILQGIVVKGLI